MPMAVDTTGMHMAFESVSQGEVLENGQSRVDEENKVIRGVKILGLVSNNPARMIGADSDQPTYRYSMEALRKAAPLYEGVSVFIDHLPSNLDESGRRKASLEDRKLKDKFGKLQNIYVTETGLFGDLHYLESHELAKVVVEAAKRMPDLLALSHYAANRHEITADGEVVVVEIPAVASVDLIGERPGTTHGLFESLFKRSQSTMAENQTKDETQMAAEAGGSVTPGDVSGAPAPQTLREKLLALINNGELDDAALSKALADALGLTAGAAVEEDPKDPIEEAMTQGGEEAGMAPVVAAEAAEAGAAEPKEDEPGTASESGKKKDKNMTFESRLTALEQDLRTERRMNRAALLLGQHGIPVTESRCKLVSKAETAEEINEMLSGMKATAGGGNGYVPPRSAPKKPDMYTMESAPGAPKADPDPNKELDNLAYSLKNG